MGSEGEVKTKICISCRDIAGYPHCGSCHEDEEEYGYEMCHSTREDVELYHCCARGKWTLDRLSDEDFQKLRAQNKVTGEEKIRS